MGTCFTRVGMNVPEVGGDCACGEFVRFDLAKDRTEHFMVCPVVDRILMSIELPEGDMAISDETMQAALSRMSKQLGVDEEAVKVGMRYASDQDRGAVGAES